MSEDYLLGLDEVGRGPLAGPLVIGAVILGPEFRSLPAYDELRDSKKLTPAKRNQLAQVIRDHALTHGLGWVKSTAIDRLGLGPALHLAARRAVKQALEAKNILPSQIIIDGTVNLLTGSQYGNLATTLKKADDLVKEVSAASIIAKVARDYYMTKLAQKYPEYGFDQHMGYGTATHLAALRQYGPCPEHRQSFRPVAEASLHAYPQAHSPSNDDNIQTTNQSRLSSPSTTDLGRSAEAAVAAYLQQAYHHRIIAQNFRTKSAEIDLISVFEGQIFFTEVKFRRDAQHGSGLDQITPAKLEQMRYASEVFLAQNPHYRQFQPLLAAASVQGSNLTIEDWLVLD